MPAGDGDPLDAIVPWDDSSTAVTRFIETLFDLPAMTARDANADALLDMFDFTQPALLDALPAPDAGSGGCNESVLTASKALYEPGEHPLTPRRTGRASAEQGPRDS